MTKEQELQQQIKVMERELVKRRAKDGFYLRYGGYITFKDTDWNNVWRQAGLLIRDWGRVKILDGADRVVWVILGDKDLKEYLEGE